MEGAPDRRMRFHSKPEQAIDLEAIHRAGGFVVTQQHIDTFPTEISDRGFEGLPDTDRVTYVLGLAAACRNYYGGYIVKDPFGSDEDRRLAWQTKMLQENGEAYDSFQRRSKLRLAPIQSVLGLFNGLVDRLNEFNVHTREAEEVRRLAAQLPHIENVATKTEFSGLSDDLAARLRAALKGTPENPHDEEDRRRLADTSWKMMSFDKKVAVAERIDELAASFLQLVTEG